MRPPKRGPSAFLPPDPHPTLPQRRREATREGGTKLPDLLPPLRGERGRDLAASGGVTRLLVREAAGIDSVVELIRQLDGRAAESGVLVLAATEQRVLALRAAIRRRRIRGRSISVETCQSFARRILRELDPRYQRGFRVIRAAERRAVMRDVLRGLGFPATSAAIEHALLAMSRMKRQAGGSVVTGFAASQQIELVTGYDRALRARRALDPHDLPSRPLRLLRHDPARLRGNRLRTSTVVVDDYTRLGSMEVELLVQFARQTAGPMVLFTAPGQAAANRFRRDFPDAGERQKPSLPHGGAKSGAAAAVASRRRVLARSTSGQERLVSYQASDDLDEAGFIAIEIVRLREAGMPLSEIAVAYRLGAAADTLQEAFQRASIPSSRVGWCADDHDTRLDVLAYLRLVADPSDDAAFARALGRPARGVAAAATASLAQLAGSLKLSLAATIPHAAMLSSLPSRTRAALRGFRSQIEGWQALKGTVPLAELVDRVLADSGYLAWAKHRQAGRLLLGQVERLRKAAAEFERLEGRDWNRFVDAMALSGAGDTLHVVPWTQLASTSSPSGRGNPDYAVVFLTGLEEGTVPSEPALSEATALEAERSHFDALKRRARVCTVLTYALTRTVAGNLVVREPSRFLRDSLELKASTAPLLVSG